MMTGISFMFANYVARPAGYNISDWGEGDRANQEWFKPLETFGERFEEYLLAAKGMGFDAIDLWTAVLQPTWGTPQHIEAAQEMLRKHNMAVYSLAGWVGDTPDEFTAFCEMASALGAEVFGSQPPLLKTQRDFMVDTMKKYGVRLGYENHPEKTPEEILARIGDGGDGTIGTVVDTGWWGTQGYDAADAIEALGPHIFQVHLKDVKAVGAHDTCRFGEGVVPIERCVRVLQKMNYQGTISIEHEPYHESPDADVEASLVMLKGWLGQ